MNPPESPENDPLDALLREQNPYIDDNGFTARVLANLPPPRRLVTVRSLVLIGAAMVGCLLLCFWLGMVSLPALSWQTVLGLDIQAFIPWAALVAVFGAVGYCVLSAVQVED